MHRRFQEYSADGDFELFWELAKPTQNSLEVKDPALPQAHKHPRSYEDGSAKPYHPPDVKEHYKHDLVVIDTIENRFQ